LTYNDIVEIYEFVNTFSGLKKKVLKPYFVKSIYINELVIEDMDNPSIRKTILHSQIATINGMKVERNEKV
jgi:hypothetical protein